MKKLITPIVALAVVAGAMWLTGNYAVLCAANRVILLKKLSLA